MPAAWLPDPDDWPTWALIDRDVLVHARDERPFLEAAAALVTEFGELTALLARAQPARDGAARDGAARDGAARDGAARDGAARDGAARDGAARDGAARDGAARDGAARDGAARDGAARDGAARDGAAEDGAASETQQRDDAVLCGLTVRIVKLTRRLAAETYEGRGELQLLLDREIFTSTAALAYLLRGRRDRFEAFVRDGLQADRDVWEHLDNNRDLRSGDNLPQEQRMRDRLARSFELAGVEPGELDLAAPSGWPAVGAQLEAIGEPDAQRMHQLGADAVHGAWNELVTHHLRAGLEGGIRGGPVLGPKLEWSPARVQPLTAVAIQGSRVMAAYARQLGHDVAEAFRDKYLDLAGRASLADRLHEEYLERADIDLGLGDA